MTLTLTTPTGPVPAELVTYCTRYVTVRTEDAYLRFRRATGDPAGGNTSGCRIEAKELGRLK